jgi:hypothetical protein
MFAVAAAFFVNGAVQANGVTLLKVSSVRTE